MVMSCNHVVTTFTDKAKKFAMAPVGVPANWTSDSSESRAGLSLEGENGGAFSQEAKTTRAIPYCNLQQLIAKAKDGEKNLIGVESKGIGSHAVVQWGSFTSA